MPTGLRRAGMLLLGLMAGVACGQAQSTEPSRFAPALPFHDGFEAVSTFSGLFPDDGSGWHGQQVEPDPNSADLSTERAHAGVRSVRFFADRYNGWQASKADLQLTGLAFGVGDHVWSSGWYFLENAPDSRWTFLWDLEDSDLMNSPGRRLYLSEGEALASDLGKWWTDEVFRQPWDGVVPFPSGRWVELVVHLYLSQAENGVLEVWQDGALVLFGQGQTLPVRGSVFDRMQVGITANGNTDHAQVLYVDDVTLSSERLP